MIEPYLLAELVVFARTGTLAKTAATLHVTQPSVTRGMQKLEADLGVRLFDRQPNRITLTATGRVAASEAANVLTAQAHLLEHVHNANRAQQRIRVASTLPGPLHLLEALTDQFPPQAQIDPDFLPTDHLQTALTTQAVTLALSDQAIHTDAVTSHYLGTEALAINLDQFMFQANQPTITFTELHGLSFLVLQDIGTWRNIIQEEIPDAKFLYQQQQAAFMEITKYSDFPYFSTNFSRLLPRQTATTDDNRVCIPISDDRAHMAIYGTYLKTEQQRVTPLLDRLVQNWPTTEKTPDK